MTNAKAVILLAAGLLSVADAHAQKSSSGEEFSCITSLELPTRGLLAAGAGESGTVGAKIYVGKAGEVSKQELKGGNNKLQAEVRVAIGGSRFSERCEGRVVELIFAFTLEDPPTDNIIPPSVLFLPPNRFELTFRRVKPNVDPMGPKPSPRTK